LKNHVDARPGRRCADKGSHAVAFCENPFHLGLPSVSDPRRWWDPFFRACEETGSVINMHIGSSSQMPTTALDASHVITSILSAEAGPDGLERDKRLRGNAIRAYGLRRFGIEA
jgi:hypothetical protein